MGERRVVHRVLVGKPEERDHLEDTGLDGTVINRRTSGSWVGTWSGLIWLRIRTGGGLL